MIHQPINEPRQIFSFSAAGPMLQLAQISFGGDVVVDRVVISAASLWRPSSSKTRVRVRRSAMGEHDRQHNGQPSKADGQATGRIGSACWSIVRRPAARTREQAPYVQQDGRGRVAIGTVSIYVGV
jgi:hypothetical protein